MVCFTRAGPDRKSTRLNSSHVKISYAVFCLKKKKRPSLPSSPSKRRHPSRLPAPSVPGVQRVRLLRSLPLLLWRFSFFFFNDTATTEIYTLSLHDALPI